MVNQRAPESWPNSSMVVDKGYHTCPAPAQGGKCLDCRQCWDPDIKVVSYGKHWCTYLNIQSIIQNYASVINLIRPLAMLKRRLQASVRLVRASSNMLQAPSNKLQAPSLKLQAQIRKNNKPQAPSCKLQAPSRKLQGPRSLNHGKVLRCLNQGPLPWWKCCVDALHES